MIDTEYEMNPDLAGALSAAQDRRQLQTYESVLYQQSPSFEIRTNVLDPSGGALYSGGSSYSPDIPFMASSSGLAGFQAPLCQRDMLGSLNNFQANLAGFDDAMNKDVKVENFKVVESAATVKGALAAAMAQKLAAQSSAWMQIANDRFAVVKSARESYGRLKSQVDDLDRKVASLVATNKSPEAQKLRNEAVNKAKLALQYQKVNALSTQLADLAMAQASILQQMADATATGNFYVIKNLAAMYGQQALVMKKAQDVRKKQLASLKGSGLQGVKPLFVDYFEEELNGLEGRVGRKIQRGLTKTLKKLNNVFSGYTIENVGPSLARKDNSLFKSVSGALSGAAIKTAAVAKQVIKRAPVPKKSTVVRRASLPVRRPVSRPINAMQIARQGEGAATAALMAGNITGVTPQQLTNLTRQAQSLVAGSAGNASDILAQARRV